MFFGTTRRLGTFKTSDLDHFPCDVTNQNLTDVSLHVWNVAARSGLVSMSQVLRAYPTVFIQQNLLTILQ
jgi:hypothetical protein